MTVLQSDNAAWREDDAALHWLSLIYSNSLTRFMRSSLMKWTLKVTRLWYYNTTESHRTVAPSLRMSWWSSSWCWYWESLVRRTLTSDLVSDPRIMFLQPKSLILFLDYRSLWFFFLIEVCRSIVPASVSSSHLKHTRGLLEHCWTTLLDLMNTTEQHFWIWWWLFSGQYLTDVHMPLIWAYISMKQSFRPIFQSFNWFYLISSHLR